MYHKNGHHVNRNHHNEKRTTMQERIRKVRMATRHGQGHTPDMDPKHVINPHKVVEDEDGLLLWG